MGHKMRVSILALQEMGHRNPLLSHFTSVYRDSFWTAAQDPGGVGESFTEFPFCDVPMTPDAGGSLWACRTVNAGLGGAGARFPSTIIDTSCPTVSRPELIPGLTWGSPRIVYFC